MTFLKGQKFPRNSSFVLLCQMGFPNWLKFFIWEHLLTCPNCCEISTTQRKGAPGKAQSTWCIRNDSPSCVHVTFRSEPKRDASQVTAWPEFPPELAALVAKKSQQKKHSFHLWVKQRPYWENPSEQWRCKINRNGGCLWRRHLVSR